MGNNMPLFSKELFSTINRRKAISIPMTAKAKAHAIQYPASWNKTPDTMGPVELPSEFATDTAE
jgi:hypothetical protein